MSQFLQEEQVEIVKHARDLTATIEEEEREVGKLERQRFKNPPTRPLRQLVVREQKFTPVYPEIPRTNYKLIDHIKSLLKINNMNKKQRIIIILLGIILATMLISSKSIVGGSIVVGSILVGYLIPLGFIYSVCTYFSRKKEINASLLNSPKYLQAVSHAEQVAREKQALYDKQLDEEQRKLDIKFTKETEKYNTILLPKYNEEKAIWKENQQRKITILKEEIRLNKEVLTTLYDETKLISVTYRPLWILCWLYDDMSSSDHDIRYATELLDRDRQRLATEEAGQIVTRAVGKLQDTVSQGLNALYEQAEYNNFLQAQTLNEVSKTRRDMNIGNIVGTVQRHNTNKMLKELVGNRNK